MSAQVTRAKGLDDRTYELTHLAKTGIQEVRPVTEVTKVTETESGAISDQGLTPLIRATYDSFAGVSQNAFAMRPAPVTEESTERKSESTADVFPGDKAEHAQAHPVIKQPVRAPKTLPEIKDPPPLVVPEFRPASAFVARITSSPKNLVALTLAVLLICGGTAAYLIPKINITLGERREEAVTKHTALPTEPSNPVAGAGTNTPGTVETSSAAIGSAPAAKDIKETTGDIKSVESTSQFESAEVSGKGLAGIATVSGTESRAHLWSGGRVSHPSENKSQISFTTSMSRPVAPARKQRSVSRAVKSKQPPVAEEQPKPAPLRVEMSLSRSVPSTPARSVNEDTGNQPPPSGIISGKPKSKVIQWP